MNQYVISMKTILAQSLILLTSICWAQAPPNLIEHRCYGGTLEDRPNAIIQTSDGGYAFVGITSSNDGDVSGQHGGTDGWLVRLSSDRNILWQRAIGGSEYDDIRSIRQTPDGGFILLGQTMSVNGDIPSNNGYIDLLVVKVDANGTIQWSKTYGGSSEETAYKIIECSQGGYLVVAYSSSNDGDLIPTTPSITSWIVRLSGSGTILWQKRMPPGLEWARQSDDGTYLIGGSRLTTSPPYNSDAYIAKLTDAGVVVWERTYGGSSADSFINVIDPNANQLILIGSTASNDGDVAGNHGEGDVWVVKLDEDGVLVWQNTLGGSGTESAVTGFSESDGGFTVLANTMFSNDGDLAGFSGNLGPWLIRLSNEGLLIWQRAFDGAFGVDSWRGDSGYNILGYGGSYSDLPCSIGKSSNDIWIAELDQGIVNINSLHREERTSIVSILGESIIVTVPDYFNASFLRILDSSGRIIYETNIRQNQLSIERITKCSGLYIITLFSNESILTDRISIAH